jgi:hypothetical protein
VQEKVAVILTVKLCSFVGENLPKMLVNETTFNQTSKKVIVTSLTPELNVWNLY